MTIPYTKVVFSWWIWFICEEICKTGGRKEKNDDCFIFGQLNMRGDCLVPTNRKMVSLSAVCDEYTMDWIKRTIRIWRSEMKFREIDKSNYWDCIVLTLDESQKGFVADNKQSLIEAAYEDGLYTLGIYHGETMVGFVLYDYDETFHGWSMSRFMIGKQFQGKGYGKQAAIAFLDYFKRKHNADKLYISVSLENTVARKMYASIGFEEIKEIEYTFLGIQFREVQMVKKL